VFTPKVAGQEIRMTPYVLKREQWVPRPLEEVFAFFAKPENLERITPPHLSFHIITPPPLVMREGALLDYVIRLRGLPMRWTTLITDYDPPHRFVDVQLRGPYSYWHHTHTFEAVDGGTRLGDEVRYLLPFGPLGSLVHGLMVRRDVEAIFAYRNQVIGEFFGA
jgi:ligand-binding SRPBCC domain-containing protein